MKKWHCKDCQPTKSATSLLNLWKLTYRRTSKMRWMSRIQFSSWAASDLGQVRAAVAVLKTKNCQAMRTRSQKRQRTRMWHFSLSTFKFRLKSKGHNWPLKALVLAVRIKMYRRLAPRNPSTTTIKISSSTRLRPIEPMAACKSPSTRQQQIPHPARRSTLASTTIHRRAYRILARCSGNQ